MTGLLLSLTISDFLDFPGSYC